MRTRLNILLCSIILAACSGPKDTPLPRELDKIERITLAMEKLTSEERELAAGYIARHTIGAKFGGLFDGKDGTGIPDGMTLGKAIEEQRKFKADAAIEDAKRQALEAKLQSEREAAMKLIREAITVTLGSRKLSPSDFGRMLDVEFGYKNNTDKDIDGVKGYISVRDVFGEEISRFPISNDNTIKAGQSGTWAVSRSADYPTYNPRYRRENKDWEFSKLEDNKFKVVWDPRMIVFKDGTKLTVP